MPLPYLRINGVELNQAEVSAYVRNSPANRLGQIVCSCDALNFNPTTGNPVTFLTPATTPAPWYDGSAASADFLGVGLEEIRGLDGSNISRQTFDRVGGGVGGSTLGPLHLKGKKLQVKALLLSVSDAGDAFGERWLTALLQSQCSGTCVPYDVNVREYCPPSGGSHFYEGWWTLRRCGVTSGLTWQPSVVFPYCVIREFTFEVTSEYGYLYGNPVQVVAPTSLFVPGGCTNFQTWICGGTSISATLSAPSFGDLCPLIVINSGSATTGEFWVEEDGNILYYINALPANTTFTIDCSTQTFVLTNNSTGVSIDGTPYLELPQSAVITWPIVNCGQTHTVALVGQECGVNSSTTASLSTVLRQL